MAIGAVCVALVCVVVTWSELIVSSIRLGYLALPPVSLAMLVVVLGLAKLAGSRLSTRFALARQELVTIYVMCLVGAMVSSHGLLQKLFPLLVTANYQANKSNNWAKLFFPNIPKWAVPWNPLGPAKQDVAKYFFERLPTGSSVPWQAWLVPLCVWGLFFALVVCAYFCLATIIQRQWIDREKLSFPLAQLPLDIIDGKDSSGRSLASVPLLWIGVAIRVVLYGIDWLHQCQATVPNIPLSININDSLAHVAKPWNQLDVTILVFSSAAIGFFYLLPVDILFSVWFFFVFTRLSQMLLLQFNMDMPRMPKQDVFLYQGYQSMAAYFVLVGYFAWIARPHLARVWRAATNFAEPIDPADDNGLVPIRVAVWGLLGSLASSTALLIAMGVTPVFALLEMVASVVVIGLVMARSTSEAGMLMTEVTWAPVDVYALFGSVHALGPRTLTMAAFADHVVAHDQRGLLLAGMLDASKLGDGAQMRGRSIFSALVLGIVIALLVAGPLQLMLPYTYGGLKMDYWMENLSPQSQFMRYASEMTTQPVGATTSTWQAPTFFAVGAIVTLFLTAMRSAFYWWPLHPLGYALAGSFSTIIFWFPCLIAWIFKSLTLRYGGLAAFQRARPFFLGLILGEFGMAFLAGLVTVLAFQLSHGKYRIPTPAFPWF